VAAAEGKVLLEVDVSARSHRYALLDMALVTVVVGLLLLFVGALNFTIHEASSLCFWFSLLVLQLLFCLKSTFCCSNSTILQAPLAASRQDLRRHAELARALIKRCDLEPPSDAGPALGAHISDDPGERSAGCGGPRLAGGGAPWAVGRYCSALLLGSAGHPHSRQDCQCFSCWLFMLRRGCSSGYWPNSLNSPCGSCWGYVDKP
jgi:hypothetical protein